MIKQFLFIFFLATATLATELNVDFSAKNKVIFISKATLESFEGITEKIDGYVLYKGEDLTEESELYFEVDLAALDTGIGLRNRHMRENYLETENYPYASFFGKVTNVKSTADNQFDVTTEGTFKIHGKEKKYTINGKVDGTNGEYHISSTFEIDLNDFDIKIPKLMFMKINEKIKIELDFNLKQKEE